MTASIKRISYCRNCVYPINAVNLSIESDGICSACHTAIALAAETPKPTFWAEKQERFLRRIQEVHSASPSRNKDFDCIVPVSGGKDSYYQVHVIKSLGLKPLLVTYHGNNYLDEGDLNRDRMKHVFNVDHIVYSPSTDVLIRLNRIGFRKLGDMNWHAHCGISTLPHRVAVQLNIPLVIWGETPWDIAGMYFHDDEADFSYQNRHDHDCRGHEWYDFVNDSEDSLNEQDLWWAKYPSDEEVYSTNLTGLYLGNYFPWEPNKHLQLMIDLYGFTSSKTSFERTYRTGSNLDDRYENGVHDLLKYIKYGYGRCSDHASKDIRSGDLTRERAIELVRQYDHVISSDLAHWLDYVGYTHEYFWKVSDTFRSKDVWFDNGRTWIKDSLWGDPVIENKNY